MELRGFTLCIAAGLAGLAPAALARGIDASATLERLGVRLIDLRPGDGIDPWVVFDPSVGTTLTRSSGDIQRLFAGSFQAVAPTGPDFVISGSLVGGDLSFVSHLVAGHDEYRFTYARMLTAAPGVPGGITLAPHTELRLTGRQTMSVHDWSGPVMGDDSVKARIISTIRFACAPGGPCTHGTARLHFDNLESLTTRDFAVRLANHRSTEMHASLDLETWFVAKAVPEPASLALGSIGLAAVLAVARRRRGRSGGPRRRRRRACGAGPAACPASGGHPGG